MKVEFEGLDEYIVKLRDLATPKQQKKIFGSALYAGAGVLADAIRAEIQTIPTVTGVYGTPENKIDGITPTQKKGLLDGFGISPMRVKRDVYDVHIGFDGYNGTRTKKHPNGQPNMLIARSVAAGTSFRRPHPFVEPAIRRALPAAEAAMQKALDEQIEQLMK